MYVLRKFWSSRELQNKLKMREKVCFLVFFLWLNNISHSKMVMATIPVDVGVVLDLDRWVGKMGLSCISMALSDFYASHSNYTTRLVLNTRNSNNTVLGAATAAIDLLKNVGVQGIIGPVTSMQANFLISIGEKAQVPIISYSATSPSLSSLRSEYFVRAALNDSLQLQVIGSFVQAFRWKEVIPIYIDNEYGEGILPYLSDVLQKSSARIPYRSVIQASASDDEIVAELYKLMTMQTRVFLVHTSLALGFRIFTKAKEIGMMSEGYVWIITDGLSNFLSSMDPFIIDSMQGVIAVKPYVPRSKRLNNLTNRWKRKYQHGNLSDVDLNIFGLWAYDAATALAMAVEKVKAINFSSKKNDFSGNSLALENFPVSQIGMEIRKELSNMRFDGLSGNFHLVNGQLQSSTFQIVNVIGKGERGIGFWTPENGITKELNVSNEEVNNSTYKPNLKTIIWPGDSVSVPKGWAIPTNGKKLRIGVPVKDGFSEFVHLNRDPNTNTTEVTGYCIDVFEAVMASLPYNVPYQYIPFEKSNGESAGSYNDLVYQVFLGKFDAVVGDVTIIANRSSYVDFTLPYTESGVTMIVPVKEKNEKDAWVFLKPLTWDLWLTAACFFISIGFVIRTLEYGPNRDFNGPLLSTSLWFSFSTMVFTNREQVMRNSSRIVVILWYFVVLILTQSYTASLTSIVTVKQLVPTVTSIHELIAKGASVGYPKDSFVKQHVKDLIGDDSKLMPYNTRDDLHEAFSNRSIAAAFDEVPYMKLFLNKYCSKYTLVEPTFKADGFGFVFPIGSPLVSDVSRAVLKVTEGDKMKIIENAWFGKKTSCPDPSTSISSSNLSLSSFWGLFLIVGVASLLALVISKASLIGTFLEDRYLDIKQIWGGIVQMITHLMRKQETNVDIGNTHETNDRHSAPSASTSGNSTPNPS